VPVIAPAASARSIIWWRASARAAPRRCWRPPIFHFGTFTVQQAKEQLARAGLPVRLET